MIVSCLLTQSGFLEEGEYIDAENVYIYISVSDHSLQYIPFQ